MATIIIGPDGFVVGGKAGAGQTVNLRPPTTNHSPSPRGTRSGATRSRSVPATNLSAAQKVAPRVESGKSTNPISTQSRDGEPNPRNDSRGTPSSQIRCEICSTYYAPGWDDIK